MSGVEYNAAGQMNRFVYGGAGGVVETRQYNPLSQLTRITVAGGSTLHRSGVPVFGDAE